MTLPERTTYTLELHTLNVETSSLWESKLQTATVCTALLNYTEIRFVLIFKMAHYDDGPEWMKWDNLFIHQSVTYRLLRGGDGGQSRFNGS